MSDDRGDVVWINVEALNKADRGDVAGIGLAMQLLTQVYFPTKQPFVFDPEALAKRMTARDATPESLARLRDAAAKFFTILPDGRWAPNPEFFSLTDGNPGGHVI